MEIKWWLVLSTEWKLQDVQAGLVVIISILAFVSVFVSARVIWHVSARRIAKSADVPISSLLSFTTLGEVIDVVILLKSKLLHGRHLSLALQCLLVVAFSTCAIFAGPISRYATRIGERDGLRHNNGLLASQSYTCEINNNIGWHNISQSLDQAKFPYDQLLDYLPDTKSNWAYHPEDWNATYTAKCSTTSEANLTLEAIGKYKKGEYWIYDNVPGLSDVYSNRFLNENTTDFQYWYSGVRNPKESKWNSMIFYSYAEMRPDGDAKTKWDKIPTQHMSVHLSTIAMEDVPMYEMSSLDTIDWDIGKGKIPRAWYSKIECDITRTQPQDKYNYWEAYIDTSDSCSIPKNMDQYFTAQSNHPHADGYQLITLPTGKELFRFFQSYQISKDTHFPHPVDRLISLRIPTVELSTLFIAVMSLLILIVIIGLIHCILCRFAYRDLYRRVPETKVDWLLQSLREAESSYLPTAHKTYGHHRGISSGSDADEEHFADNHVNNTAVTWEKARYSLANPHYSSSSSAPSPAGNYTSRPSTGFGKVSLYRADRDPTPSPAPPSLIPGPAMATTPSAPPSFVSFLGHTHNGYDPLPNPTPYQGGSPAGFHSPPVSPNFSVSTHGADRVVSYGMTSARATPIMNVGPRSEKGEWEVGIVETHR